MVRLLVTATLSGLLYAGMMLAPASALAKLKVVATVPDLAAVAREIGGPEVEVSSLSVPTQDPHFVDARPHLVLRLNRADLLILTGLDLEIGWLPTLLTGARNGRVQPGAPGYLDASTVVPLKQVPQQRIDRSMGDIHPGGNPHYMTDPRNGARVGLAIADRLGALDPAHKDVFRARAKALQVAAQRLAQEQARRFASLAPKQRQVVVYHQSLVYLLDWLGLEQIVTIEPKPGIPPSPGHIAGVLGQMRQRGVEVIVQEEYFPPTAGKLLADKTGASLVMLPGGPHFDGNQSYLSYIRTSADRLYEGFKR